MTNPRAVTRTPIKPTVPVYKQVLLGDGVIELAVTSSGSAIELYVRAVGGARASVFLTLDQASALRHQFRSAYEAACRLRAKA